ncbi:MAG: ComEC/Rec2 family competence protein [Mycoplasmatales bacterium]|nr:ComEC/Rec2 family competence protein [Mycoplasmatales bacterium]
MFITSILLAISIYLIVFSKQKIFWIYISIILIIPFIFKPKYFLFTIFFLSIALLIHFLTKQEIVRKYLNGKYRIKKVTTMGPIISDHGTNIFLKTRSKFIKHDLIYLKGSVSKIVNTNDWDKETYFYALNVKNQIYHPTIKLLEKSTSIDSKIHNFVLNGGENYRKITPLVLLGMKTDDSKMIYHLSIEMNVVHLFVISGFHISLFFIITNKIFKKMKIKEKLSGWLSILPIYVYLIILNFPLSASRATLLVTFSVINKSFFKSKFNSLELLGLTMGVMFAINPRSIYSLSFILTFMATFVILGVNNFKFNNRTWKYFFLIISPYFSNLIIIMYINHYFAIFGIIYGIILTPVFMFVYIFTLLMFPFKTLVEYVDLIFLKILKIFNKINIIIDFKPFSIEYVYLSYGILNSCFIILLIWNSYMDKNDSWLIKKLND